MRQSPKIVVIDDDNDFIKLVREVLRDEGYRRVVALNIRSALVALIDSPPGLLILDSHAAGDGGRMLITALRNHPATNSIPILVCSTDPQYPAQNRALLDGARCAFLEKPFTLTELLEQVHALFAHDRR